MTADNADSINQKCKYCGAETVGSDICHKCLDNPERQKFFALHTELIKELSPQEVIQILGSTVKKDDTTKLNVFLDMLLTYTEEDQQNVGLIAASSTGKSYIPLQLAPYFPEIDVIKLGYASPTSFFHENGVWLRDPRLPPFPDDYTEDEEEAKIRKAKENVILVDLHQKILVFLDAPHSELLKNLRSLTAHDDKYVEQRITDRTQKSGMRTRRILIVGFPTVVFCSANTLLDEQEKTRLNIYSPESSQEKLRETIAFKINKDGNKEAYRKAIEENEQRRLLQERIRDIKAAKFKNVIIPDELQSEIYDKFMELHSVLQPRHQRDIGKLLAKIKAFALLSFHNRVHTSKEFVEVNHDDVINGFAQYESYRESNELGLPPELYDNFLKMKDEFLPPGLTIDEYQKIYHQNTTILLGRDKARGQLKSYTTVGLLVEVLDPLDKRKIRYMCEGVGETNTEAQQELITTPPPSDTYSFEEPS